MGSFLTDNNTSEAIHILRDLIRIDTTNPPGNEGKASDFLKTLFDREGIECEVIGPKDRESFVARLSGRVGKPRLALLSHTDVVPVTDLSRWSHAPFAGEIDGQWVYGRGAYDDKFGVAVQAMTMILLKRRQVSLNGTLILAATADEEAGGQYGCGWLVSNVPDKIRSEYVLNEGGGYPVKIDGRIFYTVAFGEKGICWFKLKAKGKSGHGGLPSLGDNANVKMAEAFSRLAGFKTEVVVLREVRETLLQYAEALMGERGKRMVMEITGPEIDALLDQIASTEKGVAERIRAQTRMTISPNVIRGGTKINVIPDVCEAEVDTRILPGQDLRYAIDVVQEAIGRAEVGIESTQFHAGTSSPTKTPFVESLTELLKEHAGEVSTIPELATGFTDSRFFRHIGAEAYGFMPGAPTQDIEEILRGVHGDNEKTDIPSVGFAIKFLVDICQRALI